MTQIFDGKDYAAKKEEKLRKKVMELGESGVKPRLVSIIIGDDTASHLYVNLKKKAGERVGVDVEVKALNSKTAVDELLKIINELNRDNSVNGIMIQLPLPDNFSKEDKQQIINSISPHKDVDGLREDSVFLHPTSKAVLDILDLALLQTKIEQPKILLVGATGMVGRPLAKELKKRGFGLSEADSNTSGLGELCKNAEVIISATGVENLIKSDVVPQGSILVDVGSPKGDIEKTAYEKASFVSPVPGGVGPVTITALLENLVSIQK